MTVYTSALPARLPDTGAITAAAQGIATRATEANEHVSAAHAELSGVGGFFATPDTPAVTSAMNDVVRPFVADIETSVGPVRTGLDNFASDIDNLRSRYERVGEDVAEHNDWPRPPAGDPHRHAYDVQEANLRAEVGAVGRLYDEAVQRCEVKVNEGSPSPIPGNPVPSGLSFGVGLGLSATQTWFETHAQYVKVRNGRINLQVSQPIPRAGHRISAQVMQKLGIPDSYVTRYLDVFDPHTGRRLSIQDWERAVDGVDPGSPLGRIFEQYPWLERRFMDAHVAVAPVVATAGARRPPRGDARIIAQDPRGISPQVHGENRNRTHPHPDAGRWAQAGKAANWAGRGLGVLGFAGSAMDGYNNSVERDPTASPRVHATNAALDATVETAASAVGAQVGGMVGRAAGAAIGQAIIPIPGVGAAVGAVAGGFLGNVAGGLIGGQIGKGINAFRHSEGDSIGEKARDFAGGLFNW
jgi:hypothetical protein